VSKWPKMFLVREGKRHPLELPFPEADAAVVTGEICPKCDVADFRVAGSGKRPSADDRAWEADAHCVACKRPVGLIRVEVDTLFGVREDRAVLEGRCRVY
jgi:hypothetical protein